MLGGNGIEAPLNIGTKVLQHSWNADNNRNALFPRRPCHGIRCDVAGKSDRTSQQNGNEQTHRLSEHVAQRDQIQNPHRLKWRSPGSIFFDFELERFQV